MNTNRVATFTVCLLCLVFAASPAAHGEITASMTGKVVGKECYSQSLQSIACDGSQGTVNRAFVAVEIIFLQQYAGVWCERSKSNLGPCINGPNVGGTGFWSGTMLPQHYAPEPGGSGGCATAAGCEFLSPF